MSWSDASGLLDVVDRFYPGRAVDLRPINPQESKATMVIGMRIDAASAGGRRRR